MEENKMSSADVIKGTKKWGSITILSSAAVGLIVVAIGWIFSSVIDNKLNIKPLSMSMDKLSASISRADQRNLNEHQALMKSIGSLNSRIQSNEVRLFRVIEDCDENHGDIKKCQATHN